MSSRHLHNLVFRRWKIDYQGFKLPKFEHSSVTNIEFYIQLENNEEEAKYFKDFLYEIINSNFMRSLKSFEYPKVEGMEVIIKEVTEKYGLSSIDLY